MRTNKKNEKQAKREELLKNAGVDVKQMFSFQLPKDVKGGTIVNITFDNGVPVVVDKKQEKIDEVMDEIIQSGYVQHPRLYRRWIMAHYFRLFNEANGNWSNFNSALNSRYGYMYQFSMLEKELATQVKFKRNKNLAAFEQRQAFFNHEVVYGIYLDYLFDAKKFVEKLPTRNCKGVPYKRLPLFGDVFVEDLDKKVFNRMSSIIAKMDMATNIDCLYDLVTLFNRTLLIKLPYDTTKSRQWVDAFKGAGAFYTLDNLIKFHGVKLPEDSRKYNDNRFSYMKWMENNNLMSTFESLDFLYSKLNEYEGYQFHALLKRAVELNGFDFNKKMKEIYSKES